MAPAEFLAELDELLGSANAAFAGAADAAALEAARIEFLGAKSGRLKAVQKSLGSLDKADKPAGGKRFNEVKQEIEAAFAAAGARLSGGAQPAAGASDFDPTLPGRRPRLGHL
ncbi:MAG TPA: phenylalanine--tRNA ligase subunit alpha, partial [Pirellulales bacterium]|nr:phenylalanine--tRNA ligase subunit alpha [Pirellulales bacterium]